MARELLLKENVDTDKGTATEESVATDNRRPPPSPNPLGVTTCPRGECGHKGDGAIHPHP